MHFFFTTNEITGLVNSIVQNNPVPKYRSVGNGDKIIEDCKYALGKKIIKCTKTGVVGNDAKYDVETRNFLDNDNASILSNSRKNTGLKTAYSSKDVYYNSDLHERLGDYLRYYKNTTGINLMPFYNCFSYRNTNDIYISSNDDIEYGKISYAKVFIVPIRFNTTYTICVDSAKLQLATIQYNDGNIIKKDLSSVKTYTECGFNRPIYYRCDNEEKINEDHYKDTRLIIQLPKDNDSSIVVLEGEWKTNPKTQFVGNVDDVYYSRLKLMEMNDRTMYAFSDRLIEYLVGNVVTSEDETQPDIDRVIDAVKKQGVDVYGRQYDETLRRNVFNIVMSINPNLRDINGYADKDTEFVMGME